jgi:stage V sporulation protein SpoVS
VETEGIDLVSYPAFVNIDMDGEEKTSIHFYVSRR